MNKSLRIPPKTRKHLTPPQILAARLKSLVGTTLRLTGKTRTDGSNARKLVAQMLEGFPLPPEAPDGSYDIVPPKGKGIPRIRREYVDTYIVTTGESYNLQVWNRNPVGESAQIEYSSGEYLCARDVRFVFLRVEPNLQQVRSVIVLSPDYIEATFGHFGKPTLKHQLIISPSTRNTIVSSNPPVMFYPDTPACLKLVKDRFSRPKQTIHDPPRAGELLSLEVLRQKLAPRLIRLRLAGAATKNRGQNLEITIAKHLGYAIKEEDLLVGGYPDIPNQGLEVKVQDSPTVDLGRYSPEFEEPAPRCSGLSTADMRYLIALTDEKSGDVQGIVLCPGKMLGRHFSFVSDVNYKCQRSIPMDFFNRYDGLSVHNP